MSPLTIQTPSADALVGVLAQRQQPDGGWAATEGHTMANSECTALGLLALRSWGQADDTRRIEAAVAWLLQRQDSGGAFRYDDQGADATWPTPIVLLALRGHLSAQASIERGTQWLLGQRGRPLPWLVRLLERLTGQQTIELDSTLSGWPWAPDTFSWIEPTSWALLALKSNPPGAAPPVQARVREGEDMILDRACPGGGWNYGNGRVLGQDLRPYPDTTALALLGLTRRDAPQVSEGFDVLDRLLDDRQSSGLAIALATLARRSSNRSPGDLETRLLSRTQEASADTRTLALAALALAPQLDWLEGHLDG